MIWLVGNKGMLGAEVERVLRAERVPFLSSDREVDITHADAPTDFLESKGAPTLDWVVNCSGYTAVDAAEDELAEAFAVNETGVHNLAGAARVAGAALLHVSTDYVFDGTKDGEYTEDDPPHPIGAYGSSKLAGEITLQRSCDRHVIVRTAWLYGRHGRNFVDTMLRLFNQRERVTVVNDQWGSPTFATDLANAIMTIVGHPRVAYGIYHYTNAGRTNWYEFAAEIYRQALELHLAPPGVALVPTTSADYPSRTRRPANSLLSKEKIKNTFGLSIRDWRDALRAYFLEADG